MDAKGREKGAEEKLSGEELREAASEASKLETIIIAGRSSLTSRDRVLLLLLLLLREQLELERGGCLQSHLDKGR
jgi:hypothetical protein